MVGGHCVVRPPVRLQRATERQDHPIGAAEESPVPGLRLLAHWKRKRHLSGMRQDSAGHTPCPKGFHEAGENG